jgi:hypothetical protein
VTDRSIREVGHGCHCSVSLSERTPMHSIEIESQSHSILQEIQPPSIFPREKNEPRSAADRRASRAWQGPA